MIQSRLLSPFHYPYLSEDDLKLSFRNEKKTFTSSDRSRELTYVSEKRLNPIE